MNIQNFGSKCTQNTLKDPKSISTMIQKSPLYNT